MEHKFKGPTKYAVYGRMNEGGPTARISGCETLAEAEAIISNHEKSYPGVVCSIWEATWRKVK